MQAAAEAAGAFHSEDSGLVAAREVVVEAEAGLAEAAAVGLEVFHSDRIRVRHH